MTLILFLGSGVRRNTDPVFYFEEIVMDNTFEPKIAAFVCTWCTYTGADLAGTSRLKYEPNVRVVRLPCTGRIDFSLIVKAFENGADGVLISGCHPNDCHYNEGNFHARRRFAVLRKLLEFVGIDPARVQFSWVSAAEGAKWRDVVNAVTDEVRKLGPFLAYKNIINTSFPLSQLEEEEEFVNSPKIDNSTQSR